MKFRKKPVEVEAVQLRWDTWGEMCEHAGVGKLADGKPEGCFVDPATGEACPKDDEHPEGRDIPGDPEIGLWIPTLEGLMLARQSDWVIRGVKGELYPCKPDIFEATYEAVDA